MPGGTSGIGAACALALGRAGARVIVAGRTVSSGEAVVREIVDGGGTATFVAADVVDPASVAALGKSIVQLYGGLDIAVNSIAASARGARLAEETIENFDTVFAVNVRGLWLAMQMELRRMLEQGRGGTIVNIGSMAGFTGTVGAGFYGASKHAVEGLTKTASNEYAGSGIRVNAVAPGPTRTAILERAAPKEALDAIARARPIGRIAEPDEIADAVLFLASDASRYITGETIRMDGGAFQMPRIGIQQ